MKNKELQYRVDLAKWYVGEGKRKFVNQPLWVRAIIYTLLAALTLVTLALVTQLTASPPEEPKPTVVVDSSPAVVPNLKEKDRLTAESTLKNLGFTNIQVSTLKEYASNTDDVIVIDQKPTPGTSISKIDAVTLYYGSKELYEKGKKEVAMPNVVGMTRDNAYKTLTAAGFVRINVPIPADLPLQRAVVTAQNVGKDSKVPLNTEITLTFGPGLQWDETQDKLAKEFTSYRAFSKLEPLGGEDIQLTLAKKDASLTTAEALSERARSYKLGIEQVLGRQIGRVLLVNPGVEVVGDSAKAARRITEDGLTITTARYICDQEASQRMMTLNWTSQTLKEAVEAHQIVLSVVASTNDSGLESVVTCTVSGSDSAPKLVKYEVQ